MKITHILAAATMLAFVASGAVHAQGAADKAKPRTAKSLECSKQADAKGLHGKERKKFRSECKKN